MNIKPLKKHHTDAGIAVVLAIGLLLLPSFAEPANLSAPELHHSLEVLLLPEEHRLKATDDIRLPPKEGRLPALFLSPKASVIDLAINGVSAPYSFQGGRLVPQAKHPVSPEPLTLTVRYTAVFDDDAPADPVNTDNPGYGVSGTISRQGTFLQEGAGWVPAVPGFSATYRVRITAPEGTVAVTAGKSLGIRSTNGHTVSEWRISRPVGGISLSAGPYLVNESTKDGVTVATYLFAENRHLSDRYITASRGYIERYRDLFGPYPFDKFAIVENFFPTGYGYPSYTLMGSAVLRLPFIVHTSLGHEIAHCWWGNGVRVDTSLGNWSEGLTTYVADYLYKEKRSASDAAEYRRQILTDYASVIDEGSDFPLSRFQQRTDTATRIIGYGKAAMVFHMLRQTIGDRAFWQALRDLYQRNLFRTASWNDLREAFESAGGISLEPFFSQWIHRKGAPHLSLDGVRATATEDGWRVSGKILQQPPLYTLTVAVALETKQGALVEPIAVDGRETVFSLHAKEPPSVLSVDPEFHLFRRLHPEEIPPTVNALKGSDSLRVVLGEGTDTRMRASAELLVRSLRLKGAVITTESELSEKEISRHDLLLIGIPTRPALRSLLKHRIDLTSRQVILDNDRLRGSNLSVFAVFRHPENNHRVVAVFDTQPSGDPEGVARKITHYGKYGHLVFAGVDNRIKGVTPPGGSPLVVRWPAPSAR